MVRDARAVQAIGKAELHQLFDDFGNRGDTLLVGENFAWHSD